MAAVEEDSRVGADGFADMMSRILNQDSGSQIPVLSKRKTPLMREHDLQHQVQNEAKKQKTDKRAEKEKQLVCPDVLTADFERELKRLATRGVVALFNAISQARIDTIGEEGQSSVGVKTKKSKSSTTTAQDKKSKIKHLTKDLFVSSLKSDITGSGNAASSSADHAKEGISSQWAALRDDFMLDKGTKLKNWDKDDDSNSCAEESVE